MLENVFPELRVPIWLIKWDRHSRFSKESILDDSLFYVSSGIDTEFIFLFKDKIKSFIYCDLFIKPMMENDELTSKIQSYYDLKHYEQIDEEILSMPTKAEIIRHALLYNERWFTKNLKQDTSTHWYLYEDKKSPNNFKKMISFLYLCNESVLTFRHLYARYKIAPKVMVIKRAGLMNYADFYSPNDVLFNEFKYWNLYPEYIFSDQKIEAEYYLDVLEMEISDQYDSGRNIMMYLQKFKGCSL